MRLWGIILNISMSLFKTMHSDFSILKDVKVAVEVIREIRIKVNLFGKKGNNLLSPKYLLFGIWT